MEKNTLKLLQQLPLDIKIAKSKQRIREWVNYIGEENVYISFSGGKDSTTLLHLVRSLYPNIPAVFSNTGLEFPELVAHVKSIDNVIMIRPSKSFKQVIEEYGYPMLSKKQARMIYDCQHPTTDNARSRKLYLSDYVLDKSGECTDKPNRSFKISKKYRYLIDSDIKISHKCCDILKKQPLHEFEKQSHKRPIIGTMACESKMRESVYLKSGCNVFDERKGVCTPLGFWTDQDILEYIIKFNLKIPSVYGNIIEKDGKLTTTGEKRTGCIYCGFGVHLEKGINRYQRLKRTHPQLFDYCMYKLGFKEVCDRMGIETE